MAVPPTASSPRRAVMRISLRLGSNAHTQRRGLEEAITSSSLLTIEISFTPRAGGADVVLETRSLVRPLDVNCST